MNKEKKGNKSEIGSIIKTKNKKKERKNETEK
jgi:hypothetical protein